MGDRTHADGLVERVEGRHAVKLCDDSFADGENTRAGGRGDVQPRLETRGIDTASPGDAVARQGRDESIRSDTSNRARRTLRRVDYRFAAIGVHFQSIWKDRGRGVVCHANLTGRLAIAHKVGRVGSVSPLAAHAHPVFAHGAGRTRVSIPTSSVGTRLPGEKYQ